MYSLVWVILISSIFSPCTHIVLQHNSFFVFSYSFNVIIIYLFAYIRSIVLTPPFSFFTYILIGGSSLGKYLLYPYLSIHGSESISFLTQM